MKRVFFNFQDPVNSYPLNERGVGLLKPGRYKGYSKATKESSGIYKITHDKTNRISTVESVSSESLLEKFAREVNPNIEGKVLSDKSVVLNYGVCVMPTGVVVHDTDDIRVNITQNNLSDTRFDLLVINHEYINIAGGASPTYEVVVGTTPGSLPTLPSQDKKIALGIFEVPKGNIDTVAVRYLPLVAPQNGDLSINDIINAAVSSVTVPEATDDVKGIVKFANLDEAGTSGNSSTALTPQGFYNNTATVGKYGITRLSNNSQYQSKPNLGTDQNNVVTVGLLHDNLPIMNNNVERLTTANYTLKPEDNGKILAGFMSQGTTIVTVPSGLPTRFHVGFMFGTSNIEIQASGTTIIKKTNSAMRMVEVGSAMLLNSTGLNNQFILTGDLFDSRYN